MALLTQDVLYTGGKPTAYYPVPAISTRRIVRVLRLLALLCIVLVTAVLLFLGRQTHHGPFRKYFADTPPSFPSEPSTLLRDKLSTRGPGEATLPARTPMSCGIDMPRLAKLRKRYTLDMDFDYLQRYVRFTGADVERKSVTEVEQDFLPHDFITVNASSTSSEHECPAPLDVVVPLSPSPETVDASNFMFGISTSLARFMGAKTNSIREWQYWLTDGRGSSNGGKLVLLLTGTSQAQAADVKSYLGEFGIDADVYPSDGTTEMAVRYLSLIPAMYNHPEADRKKWLVTCDDDTFFPSMHSLISRMSEYDHTKPMYVGALSEDVNNIIRHGSQAFGGAGVFLSLPMAKVVTENHDRCTGWFKVREADTGWGPQGDVMLRKCIYEHSAVRLTHLPGLWQLDITGDPAGFYESGIRPLSLHHYRGGMWHQARPLEYAKTAYACGEDCVMQRFRTADDFLLSTYSVAAYPRGIDFDLSQMERTFSALPHDFGGNLDYAMGPQRPKLAGSGKKVAWELRETEIAEDGAVVQVYTRKKNDRRFRGKERNRLTERDGLIELVWIPMD